MAEYRRARYLWSLQPDDLRRRNLRYCLLTLLHRAGGPRTITGLIAELERLGLRVGGTDPHKVVSDALRYEQRIGRVERVRRGTYVACTARARRCVDTGTGCVTCSRSPGRAPVLTCRPRFRRKPARSSGGSDGSVDFGARRARGAPAPRQQSPQANGIGVIDAVHATSGAAASTRNDRNTRRAHPSVNNGTCPPRGTST